MSSPRARPKAVCVVRRGQDILVGPGYDPTKREEFFAPLGGGVEFGELAADAVRREMREELGVELSGVELLGVLESIFTYDGAPGHEIVFVFDGQLENRSLYERERIVGTESNGQRFVAVWRPLDSFGRGAPPLYPDGLLELLGGRRQA